MLSCKTTFTERDAQRTRDYIHEICSNATPHNPSDPSDPSDPHGKQFGYGCFSMHRTERDRDRQHQDPFIHWIVFAPDSYKLEFVTTTNNDHFDSDVFGNSSLLDIYLYFALDVQGDEESFRFKVTDLTNTEEEGDEYDPEYKRDRSDLQLILDTMVVEHETREAEGGSGPRDSHEITFTKGEETFILHQSYRASEYGSYDGGDEYRWVITSTESGRVLAYFFTTHYLQYIHVHQDHIPGYSTLSHVCGFFWDR